MVQDFTDRVAIVTGASSGLGAATVRRLAAGGARVWAAARSQDLLAELADGCADLPGEGIERFVSRVPCCGLGSAARAHDSPDDPGGQAEALCRGRGGRSDLGRPVLQTVVDGDGDAPDPALRCFESRCRREGQGIRPARQSHDDRCALGKSLEGSSHRPPHLCDGRIQARSNVHAATLPAIRRR